MKYPNHRNNTPKDNNRKNPSTFYKKKGGDWDMKISEEEPKIGANDRVFGMMQAGKNGGYTFQAMANQTEIQEDFADTRTDDDDILDKDRHEEPRPADIIKGQTHTLGTITESAIYIGLNDLNELYDALKDAAINSTTNASSIELKHTMVVGSGFLFKEANAKKNEALLKKYGVKKLFKKSVLQFIGFGNTFVRISKNSTSGQAKECSFELLECAFTKLRFGRVSGASDTYEGMPSKIGYSYEFYTENQTTPTDASIVNYSIYPEFEADTEESAIASSVIHLKNDTIGRIYLGLPSWYAGRIAAKADYSIGRTNLNKFENGMKPDYLIVITGSNPSSPDAMKLIKSMEKRLKGLANTGKSIIMHAPVGSTEIKFIKISGDLDGDYLKLWEQVKFTIAQGQKLSPALAGIAVAGKLGDLQSLRLDFELLNNGVINKMQQDFIDEILMPIFETIDEVEGSTLADDFEGLKSAPPLSYKTELKPADYTQVNEARTMNGLSEDPEMKGKYISQNLQQIQAPTTPPTP